MSTTARIFEVFVGLVLIVTGMLIIYALHAHGWRKQSDVWDVGFILLVEAYSIVGSLFILLGSRYALGGTSSSSAGFPHHCDCRNVVLKSSEKTKISPMAEAKTRKNTFFASISIKRNESI